MNIPIGKTLRSKITITLNDDGTVSVNSTELMGDDKGIMAELERLAAEIGGELKVEKHVHKHTFSITNKNEIKNKS